MRDMTVVHHEAHAGAVMHVVVVAVAARRLGLGGGGGRGAARRQSRRAWHYRRTCWWLPLYRTAGDNGSASVDAEGPGDMGRLTTWGEGERHGSEMEARPDRWSSVGRFRIVAAWSDTTMVVTTPALSQDLLPLICNGGNRRESSGGKEKYGLGDPMDDMVYTDHKQWKVEELKSYRRWIGIPVRQPTKHWRGPCLTFLFFNTVWGTTKAGNISIF